MPALSSPLVPAQLEFDVQGTPISKTYQDIYHSADGGLDQARHVFIAGNRIKERWRNQALFTILETGFGLGLNFLATWQAWREDPDRCERLHFVSIEKHPFSASDLARLHQCWPELADQASELRAAWPPLAPGAHRLLLNQGRVTLTLFLGDANGLLPRIVARANALYLDGFAPSKNPDLWSESLLRRLSRCCAPDATLATWTVAASVRKSLQDAGWELERSPGFGSKRDMLTGRRRTMRSRITPVPDQPTGNRNALVVGAGIAGCAVAEALARRGWQVQVIERHSGPAREASGNPAGLFHPALARDDNYIARLSRACTLYLARLLPQLGGGLRYGLSGVLQLARDEVQDTAQREVIDALALPKDYADYRSRDEASTLAGQPLAQGGWYYPAAGWVSPPTLCAALLARWPLRITTRYGIEAAALLRQGEEWSVWDTQGNILAQAPLVVVTSAYDSARLLPEAGLSFENIRGQVSVVPAGVIPTIHTALCGNGYVTPVAGEVQCFGATYDFRDEDPNPRREGHITNLAHLQALLPMADLSSLDPDHILGRVGFRTTTPDRLPNAGPVPNLETPGRREAQLAEVPRAPGLHTLCGLGSRGMVWAPLAAELIAARIEGEPLPLERELVDALDPARFLLRLRKSRT